MKEQKIVIDLPNGDQLSAEVCPHDGGQIAVGIIHDGVWIQDLAVVETDNKDGKYVEDKYNIYVYGSEWDECYTECFNVDRKSSNAL